MTNTYEQLKNIVRRITEPCSKCWGGGKGQFNEIEGTEKNGVVEIEFETCPTCQGRGWCPKLEEGCVIQVIVNNEKENWLYINHGLYLGHDKRIWEIEPEHIENLGKELKTREVLLAIHYVIDIKQQGLDSIGADIYKYHKSMCEMKNESINVFDKSVKIPLDKDPIDWGEETINKVIEILQ